MKKNFLLFLCLFFTMAKFVLGQTENSPFIFSHLPPKLKTTQNDIHQIHQDKNGLIWIINQVGVDLYLPNIGIKHFPFQDLSNYPSPCFSAVIHEDEKGRIWTGTCSGLGIINYNPKVNITKLGELDSINITSVYTFASTDLQKKFLLLTNSQEEVKLYEINNFEEKNNNPLTLSSEIDYGKILKASQIIPLKGNAFLFKNNDSLTTVFFNDQDSLIKNTPRLFAKETVFLGQTIQSLGFDNKSSTIWVLTDSLLFQKKALDMSTGSWEKWEIDQNESLQASKIKDVLFINPDSLWVATDGDWIFHLKKQGTIFRSSNIEIKNIVSGEYFNRIGSICRSRDGVIWLGTNGQGVQIYSPYKQSFLSYKLFSKDSIKDSRKNHVWSIHPSIQGADKYWIGTDLMGLLLFDIKKEKILWKVSLKGKNNDKRPLRIISLASKGDTLLIGTSEGLFSLMQNFEVKPKAQQVITSTKADSILIRDILVNKESIYLGCTDGLFSSSKLTPKWRELRKKGKEKLGVTSLKAMKDTLFVGTENGFYILDEIGGFSDVFLENTHVMDFKIDEDSKILWAATSGRGLIKVNWKNKLQKPDTIYNGEVFYSISEDSKGCLWLSANSGLYKIDLHNNTPKVTIIKYKKEDGLQHDEFNFGASYNNNGNVLAFGGLQGFTLVPIESKKSNHFGLDQIYIVKFEKQSPNPREFELPDFEFHGQKNNHPIDLSLRYDFGYSDFAIIIADYQDIGRRKYVLTNTDTLLTSDPNFRIEESKIFKNSNFFVGKTKKIFVDLLNMDGSPSSIVSQPLLLSIGNSPDLSRVIGLLIVIFLVLLSSILFYRAANNEISLKEKIEAESKLIENTSRLAAYGLSEHFIGNTIKTVRELALHKPPGWDEGIEQYKSFLKRGVRHTTKSFISILEEDDIIKEFIILRKKNLEMLKMEHAKIIYSGLKLEGQKNFYIPAFILINLVENAIKQREKGQVLHLALNGFWEDSCLILELVDDGKGFPETLLKKDFRQQKSSIGFIQNLFDALQKRFGKPVEFKFGNNENRDGAWVQIKIHEDYLTKSKY